MCACSSEVLTPVRRTPRNFLLELTVCFSPQQPGERSRCQPRSALLTANTHRSFSAGSQLASRPSNSLPPPPGSTLTHLLPSLLFLSIAVHPNMTCFFLFLPSSVTRLQRWLCHVVTRYDVGLEQAGFPGPPNCLLAPTGWMRPSGMTTASVVHPETCCSRNTLHQNEPLPWSFWVFFLLVFVFFFLPRTKHCSVSANHSVVVQWLQNVLLFNMMLSCFVMEWKQVWTIKNKVVRQETWCGLVRPKTKCC